LALVGLDRPVAAVRGRRNRGGGRGAGRRGRGGRPPSRAGGGDGRRRGRRRDWHALATRALLTRAAARRTLATLPKPRVEYPITTAGGDLRRDRLGANLLRLDAPGERRATGGDRAGQLNRLQILAFGPDDVDLGPGLRPLHLAVQGSSLGVATRANGNLLVRSDADGAEGDIAAGNDPSHREPPHPPPPAPPPHHPPPPPPAPPRRP